MMFFACFVTCLKVFEENTTHGSHSNTVIKNKHIIQLYLLNGMENGNSCYYVKNIAQKISGKLAVLLLFHIIFLIIYISRSFLSFLCFKNPGVISSNNKCN